MLSSLFDRWPLRRQIVLVAGGAILLFGLGAAEFVRQNEMRAFERTFGEQSSKLVGTLAAASLDAVLSADRPVLDTVIQSLVEEDPEIEAVTVLDDRGDPITSWRRDPDVPLDVEGCIGFERDVVLEGEVYGRFEVLWNVSRQHAEIRGYAARIYLYAAGISVALALLVLGLVDALVVRPVRIIHERLRELEGGAEPAPLQLAGARELRDIGATVHSLGDVLALRRAKEAELEAVSRQKSEFLANMSHELRTPMNGVLGMLALVEDTPLNPSQAEQVRIAGASGRNLLRLINDILDFSKVEAGKLEFESIDFDLEALVDESVEVLAGQAHAKGLELACRVAGTVPVAVRGDPTRLRQVLTNLTGNAIKFTAEGRVDVVVGPADAYGPPRPGSLRFEIVDTGVGIPQSALETVFESFAQADGSTTRNYGGTGLGLAISRQLIEGMGGAIGVDSTVGRGSRFWFELELAAADAQADAQTDAETGAGAVTAAERARATLVDAPARSVVFASSDPLLLDRLHALCTELDVEAEHVRDASSVLAALRREAVPGRARTLVFDTRLEGMPPALLVRLVEAEPAFDDVALVPLDTIGATDADFDPQDCPRIVRTLSRPVTRTALVRLLACTGREAPSDAERDADERRRRARFAELTVLIVEDNPVNQEVALGMLARIGVRAEVADNGREGLERIEADRFDAVLMDCQMPVMDGYAATRALREREAAAGDGSHLPVIALTANAMQGDAERCLAAGMDDYLAKPFDPVRLEEVLLRWLTGPEAPSGEDGADERRARDTNDDLAEAA